MYLMKTWDVTYKPFPQQLKSQGFDHFFRTIADELHGATQWEQNAALATFADLVDDISLSAHFDREIVFTIDTKGIKRSKFQDMVADFLMALGMEGSVTIERIVTVMEE